MMEKEHSDWEFGFWSALTLEILVRAAISNISPALVADGKDWNNILYAVGTDPNQQKFTPKSADISDLLKRAENLFPDFTREMLNFSIAHITKETVNYILARYPLTAWDLPLGFPCFTLYVRFW